MGDIYTGSALAIAATASRDSAGGLSGDREPTLVRPLWIETTWDTAADNANEGDYIWPPSGQYWCDIEHLWTEAVEGAPLNQRAWVCQERMASRTAHFSDTQLFWECHKLSVSENYPSGLPDWAFPFWCDNTSALKKQLYQYTLQTAKMFSHVSGDDASVSIEITECALRRELYFSWLVFRITYTRCAMTKAEDRLVAIQGVA
jgi:hypothetical protein